MSTTTTAAAFQASLIYKPPPSLSVNHCCFLLCRLNYFSDLSSRRRKLSSRFLYPPLSIHSRVYRHSSLVVACTLHSDSSGADSFSPDKIGLDSSDYENEEFRNDVSSGDVLRNQSASESTVDVNNNNNNVYANLGKQEGNFNFDSEKDEFRDDVSRIESASESTVEVEGNNNNNNNVYANLGKQDGEFQEDNKAVKGRLPAVVFLIGLFAMARKSFDKLMEFTFSNWWPLWQHEKRLNRLISEADENPKDSAKQSALLVELNKHRPEAVIERFEQRDHAVDSIGVAEYLRALVKTNGIADYLPDEKSGKRSSLPSLLQELKQRATGNLDEPFVSPGISERQPLHVLLVNPKVSASSRYIQDFLSTILVTIALCLLWYMGAVALPKYVGSLGGTGTSGASSSSYSFKEQNKEVMPEKNVKTFKDVKGCDDAKQELEEVVEYLKNPAKFNRLGGKLPKGILLTGAPGTGKTLLAKAIAGEAGVPFFYRAGSEFEEMFVGVGARRVRSLFQAARKKAPCIIFIDEIDAIGATRKQWEGHSKKTLHQLLVEMDGFEHSEGVIVMAATNFPGILDAALLRPGRFDRHIVVPKPDVKGRLEILNLYMQEKPMADDVDLRALARGTPGLNGADLANLVNTAAIKASLEGAEKLTTEHLEYAKDRILMGTERKTLHLSAESKKLTAYHESGHALVTLKTEGAPQIHKATIMPRGSALGMVSHLPSGDETSMSKRQLLARLDVCMGGRVAEELIFGQNHITTGARNDLKRATELARFMVSVCGMSDLIGPVHIKDKAGSKMQSRIDAEVVKLLKEAYDRAKALLKKHEKGLHALANALLENETLTAEQMKRILLPYGDELESESQEQQQQKQKQQVEEEELIFA